VINFPRSVARACGTVFRRLLPTRGSCGPPAAFGLLAGPDGLHLRFVTPDATVEYHYPGGPYRPLKCLLPLSLLADCSRGSGTVNIKPLPGGEVGITWDAGGVPQSRKFPCRKEDLPKFPQWAGKAASNDPELLAALDQAMQTACKDAGRYALNGILLRGGRGEIVGTDGRQLYIHGGVRLPFRDDVLVPRVTLFGSRDLDTDGAVTVVRNDEHVLFRAGKWTIALKELPGAKYPDVDAVVPKPSAVTTTWKLAHEDIKELEAALAQLRTGGTEPVPVTVELGKEAKVRFIGDGEDEGRELSLSRSGIDGRPVQFTSDARYLARALQLRFDVVQVTDPTRPLVCRDGFRTYVWMPIDGKPPTPARPKRLPPSVTTPARDRSTEVPPHTLQQPNQDTSSRRDESEPDGGSRGFFPSLFSKLAAQFREFVALAREQRRTEEFFEF
jgi:hypothetical protein